MEQRRKFSRVGFDAECTIVMDGCIYQTHLIDISMKGALVERPQAWEDAPKRRCHLILKLDDGGTTLSMEMEEARIIEGQLGLICVSIDVDSATHLRRLLELNFGDASLVERELVEF